MANEELLQRKYFIDGKMSGDRFGDFEEFNLGATSVKQLKLAGLKITIPQKIAFPFKVYRAPAKPEMAKPDRVYVMRRGNEIIPVAIAEDKSVKNSSTDKQLQSAAEQALYAASACGVSLAIAPAKKGVRYIDVKNSIKKKKLIFIEEARDFNPSVLEELLNEKPSTAKDPAPLAEKVWQLIWHATQEEPKSCLLTFVEVFVLKFLSDNLPKKVLPENYRFSMLLMAEDEFESAHGMTSIDYYVRTIRPFIKGLFPDNTIATDPTLPAIFGIKTLVSKTSVINGFAFLKPSSNTAISASNKVFREILEEFQKFGPLNSIDPEFKLRLYEKFLKRSARQQKLGQFFTPRNVVQPMIKMAQLGKLQDGAVVLDPAAGVGGFILEPMIIVPELINNVQFSKGAVTRRIKFIGCDVDANTHILAKANVLIHFAESVRNPAITMQALNQLMAETFVIMNTNPVLGALEYPPQGSVDVILTNPPYVTRGSGTHKQAIQDAGISGNGVDLGDYYNRAGLGLEALFLRYISGALKPGGRAFVIVPLGLLNRTEPTPKRRILDECNLVASIALPRNTFFNTAQLTYILVLERRYTDADDRPAVLCGLARSIGESLDWERTPNPSENDLLEIAEEFIKFSGKKEISSGSKIVKLVPADEFSENDRWDVTRFWSEAELIALGQKETTISRLDYIDETKDEMKEIIEELERTRAELASLKAASKTATLGLADSKTFGVRSGTRVTNKQVRDNPGDLPVFSCFRNERETKGSVDPKFFTATRGGVIETKPIVTINANGASVGHVYVRRERCALTDDVIAVELKNAAIDIGYLAVALREAVEKGGFLYEAKLFTTRVKELEVEIPVDQAGDYDMTQQQKIASAVQRFDSLRTRLHDLGLRSMSARVI